MNERRPASVDELLDNVSGLLNVLHEIVDMNRKVRIRTYRLAEQFGIDFSTTSDFADQEAEKLHRMLYRWEDENTGTSHLHGKKPSLGDDI